MTCREKLKIEHPECVGDNFGGGCRNCPHEYGYLDKPEYCTMANDCFKCIECWDRELPCTTDKLISYTELEKIKAILSGMKSKEQYEGKSVCELLEENRDLRKRLEEKEKEIGDLKNRLRHANVTTSMYRLMYNRLETRLDNLGKIMSEMERKLEGSKE